MSPYSYPSCGGGMWETPGKEFAHLRCHTGHTFSYRSLYREKSKKIVESLYVALRMLEERICSCEWRSKRKHVPKEWSAKVQQQKIIEMQSYIDKVREGSNYSMGEEQADIQRGISIFIKVPF